MANKEVVAAISWPLITSDLKKQNIPVAEGRKLEFFILIAIPILWIAVLEILPYRLLLIHSFWGTEYLTVIFELYCYIFFALH